MADLDPAGAVQLRSEKARISAVAVQLRCIACGCGAVAVPMLATAPVSGLQ